MVEVFIIGAVRLAVEIAAALQVYPKENIGNPQPAAYTSIDGLMNAIEFHLTTPSVMHELKGRELGEWVDSIYDAIDQEGDHIWFTPGSLG